MAEQPRVNNYSLLFNVMYLVISKFLGTTDSRFTCLLRLIKCSWIFTTSKLKNDNAENGCDRCRLRRVFQSIRPHDERTENTHRLRQYDARGSVKRTSCDRRIIRAMNFFHGSIIGIVNIFCIGIF